MTATDHAGLLNAVAADPDDRLSRLALADGHEERGEALEAECWRWLARSGKRPIHDAARWGYRLRLGQAPWWWRPGTEPSLEDGGHTAALPEAWCYEMGDDDMIEGDDAKSAKCFRSPQSAYLAAVAAWCRLTEVQRREAWGTIEGEGEGEGDEAGRQAPG